MAQSECIGEFCIQAGISADDIIGCNLRKLTQPLNKGVMYELNCFRRNNDYNWFDFYTWIEKLHGSDCCLPSLGSIKVSIGRLEKKRSELSRNKESDQIECLFREPFFSSVMKVDVREQIPFVHSSEPALQQVNADLAHELKSTEEALANEQSKNDDLVEKLSKLSVRNTNKKIRRRDKKISDFKSQIVSLQKENKLQVEQLTKLEKRLEHSKQVSEQNRVASCRSSQKATEIAIEKEELLCRITDMEEHFMQHIERLEAKISDISASLDVAKSDRDHLADRLHQLESERLSTKQHQQRYLDNVRQCCIELLSLNVGVKQIGPVIRSVLHNIAAMDIDTLPAPSTLTNMLVEMKGIACQQLGEVLSQEENVTLHSDGTSKYGMHYVGFQMSAESSPYSLGLSEMITGSANQTLATFKQIIGDIELVAGTGIGEKIVGHIKNTMSDRHIVQKNFNSLLEDYRSQILPNVVSNWDALSVQEQGELASLNNFFCGMHVIVGMADTASSTLHQWETSHFGHCSGGSQLGPGPVLVRKSESGTVRLIRTVCKHGSEQSGVYQPFTNYLRSTGVLKNPLATFRGNRFNILFYDAGVVYYLSPLIKSFFTQVWQTPNQLLKAIMTDIEVSEYLAGCRALGLVNKIITAPLWRVMESDSRDTSILDMNRRFETLLACLERWSLDASVLLVGEATLFEDFLPSNDEVYTGKKSVLVLHI